MRQINQVLLLAATGRTVLPGEEAAPADTKNTAHPVDREAGLLRFDEAEGHRLPSFTKNAPQLFFGCRAYTAVRRGPYGWLAIVGHAGKMLAAAQLTTRAEAFEIARRKADREGLPALFEVQT